MQLPQDEKPPNKYQEPHRVSLSRLGFVLVLLFLIAVATTVWIYLGTGAGVFLTILFTAFSLVFSFLQLTPPLFPKQNSSPNIPPIIVHLPPTHHTNSNLPSTNVATDTNEKGHTEEIISPNKRFLASKRSSQSAIVPVVWNIPYPRNPFFTGREELLQLLRNNLIATKATALTQPQAISGLGGIGKTQIAVEYAYRYRSDYHTVLWVRADSQETLEAEFTNIARILQLPGKNAQNQWSPIHTIKQWLATNIKWLLILDNTEDLNIVSDVLPSEKKGHIILTTRSKALGAIAQGIEIGEMNLEEGVYFLLRRAKIIAPEIPLDTIPTTQLAIAKELVHLVDGLPLALDQAGAYIEETGCGLADYLNLYRTNRRELLQRRSKVPTDHPESVFTTWSISFKRIERANPAASHLLNFCAFLDPGMIPEEVLTVGAPELGPTLESVASNPFKLNEAIEELLSFSLIRRNSEEKVLGLHRLLQAVLLDNMQEDLKRQWTERAELAVNRAFPVMCKRLGEVSLFVLLLRTYIKGVVKYLMDLIVKEKTTNIVEMNDTNEVSKYVEEIQKHIEEIATEIFTNLLVFMLNHKEKLYDEKFQIKNIIYSITEQEYEKWKM